MGGSTAEGTCRSPAKGRQLALRHEQSEHPVVLDRHGLTVYGEGSGGENGLIKLVRCRQSEELLDELTAFPHGAHDDCVDALSGAHTLLVRRGSGRMTSHVPKGRIPLASDAYRVGTYRFGSPLGLASSLGATWYRSRPR